MRARYFDSMKNEIYRSTYESYLAQHILNNSVYWADIFNKLNAKIIELIKYNKHNSKFINYLEGYTSLDKTTILKFLANKDRKENKKSHFSVYTNQFGFDFYKPFFENIFEHAKLIPQNSLEKQLSPKQALHKANKTYRPKHLFSESGRGRKEKKAVIKSFDAGILSRPATPPSLSNQLIAPITPAKYSFERNPESPTIQLMEENELPFAAGPSGSLGFMLAGAESLLGEELYQDENFKKLIMGFTASLVYNGHHTFADVGLVINALAQKHPGFFKIDPTLQTKEYYHQFLTTNYRVSHTYHEFYSKNNPAKYSAFTWEILRDAVTELDKRSILYTRLNHFVAHKKTGELDPIDLEKLKYLLKDFSPLLKTMRTENQTRDTITLCKLIHKFTDSGLLLTKPESPITWLQLKVQIQNVHSDDPAVKNLGQFLYENFQQKKRGEILGKDLQKLYDLLKEIKVNDKTNPAIISLKNKLFPPLDQKKDAQGYTAFLHAVDKGKIQMVQHYLECKANIEDKTPLGFSPLHLATMHGQVSIVKMLLESKANIEAKSHFAFSPLELALMYGQNTIVKELIEASADTTLLKDKSLLINAVKKGDSLILQTLLESKASYNSNTTLPHIAAFEGHKSILQVLLKHKVDIDVPDENGLTPLHFAASLGRIDIIQFLTESKECKVNVNRCNIERRATPAHLAISKGHIEAFKTLIAAKTDLTIENKTGETLAHFAARNLDSLKYLKECKEYHLDFNKPNKQNKTPLSYAIEAQRWSAIVFMLTNMGPAEFNHLNATDKKFLRNHRPELTHQFIKMEKAELNTLQRQENIRRVVESENIFGILLNKTGSALPSLFTEDREATKKIIQISEALNYKLPKKQKPKR